MADLIKEKLKEIDEKVDAIIDSKVKGLASNKEVTDGLKEAIGFEFEKMAEEAEKKITETTNQVVEMEKGMTELRKQIKTLIASNGSHEMYKGFKSIEQAENFGLVALASLGNTDAAKTLKDRGFDLVKAMGDDNASGNYLVPDEFYPVLLAMIEKYGVLRSEAKIWPMSSASVQAPVLMGGMTVYCPAAGSSVSTQDLTMRQATLVALKWMAYTLINNELTEDAAIAIGPIIANEMARAFARQEDACGFVGDGTKTYFNIKGLRQKIYEVNATVGSNPGFNVQGTAGAWSAIDADDLLGTAGILPEWAEDNAKWYCNKRFYYTVMLSVALGLGGANATEMINSIATKDPTFLGSPARFVSAMPSTKPAADHCPLLFGDLYQAVILGDRRGFEIAQSKEVAFDTDQLAVRGSQRIAIQVVGEQSKDEDGNDTAGAAVGFWADIA